MQARANGRLIPEPIVEEGWLHALEKSQREHELKKEREYQLAASRSKWVFNLNLKKLPPMPGSPEETLFLQLFRSSIRANSEKLRDTNYVCNVMQQTKQFEDKSAEFDLESQELQAYSHPRYQVVAGKLWDTFSTQGQYSKSHHHRFMRQYFTVFERHGRRLIAEGMAMGASHAANELLSGESEGVVERGGLELQLRLRQIKSQAVDMVCGFGCVCLC